MVDPAPDNKFKSFYSCSCHPFETVADVKKACLQKFQKGEEVTNRCNGKKGIIFEINFDSNKGYVIVKYGPNVSDEQLMHVSELIKASC